MNNVCFEMFFPAKLQPEWVNGVEFFYSYISSPTPKRQHYTSVYDLTQIGIS